MDHPNGILISNRRSGRFSIVWRWGLWATGWLLVNGVWITSDSGILDGDESGHVGAAELFRVQLESGSFFNFLRDALMGDLGEYPPLFPAFVGLWWWLAGGGLPAELWVRICGAVGMLLAAWAVSRVVRDAHDERSAEFAFGVVLLLPLLNGLSRHFMPEGFLTGVLAVVGWLMWRLVRRPTWQAAACLGLGMGLALLVKQSALFTLLIPMIWVIYRMPTKGFLAVGVASIVAGPWWYSHFAEQIVYGTTSAASGAAAGIALHVAYYPIVILILGLGPVLTLALVGVFASRGRAPKGGGGKNESTEVYLAALMILGTLLVLLLLPKKYPRLLSAAMPWFAVWLGPWLAQQGRAAWAVVASAALWSWLASFHWTGAGSVPSFLASVDVGCQQRWIRPPMRDDLGFASVLDAAKRAPDGPVVVSNPPDIPCQIQTAHPWIEHLGPLLRWSGEDRPVVVSSEPVGALNIVWGGADTHDHPLVERVDVPLLSSHFVLWAGTGQGKSGTTVLP